MLKKLTIFLTILITFAGINSCQTNNQSKSMDKTDQKVKEILATLTLEQKVGQMTQLTLGTLSVGKSHDKASLPITLDPVKLDSAFRICKLGSVLNTVNNHAQTPEEWNRIVDQLQKIAIAETGIPLLYGVDAIHGTTYTAGGTLFPQQINQGATFNPELVKRLNQMTAYEMRASGIPWNFAPVQDLGRDPRDPRFWETYGEDILVCRTLGEAAVIGMQGEHVVDIDKFHAAACLKHFLAYNSNSGKDRNPLEISVRELKERHAASFQAAMDAGAKTIMINSGLINGIPVHASYDILTQLARNEMGFDGMIVTDWADIDNLYKRDKFASSPKEAVKLAINAGIDMSMVPYSMKFCEYLIELVNEGEVPMSRIDDAVSRILKLKLELGLFEHPTTSYKDYPDFGSKKHEQLSMEAALESITVLENIDQILPLKKTAKVLVTGPNANSMRTMNGGWSYSWQGEKVEIFTQHYNTFLEAIQNKIGKKNVVFTEGVSYDMQGKYYEEINIDIASAVKAAKGVDYILLFLGENTYCEKPGDLHDLYISENQTQLALELAKTGKPVVLILNEGRPRLISKFEQKMAAVVQTYLPSNFGGDALAEVLFGDVNPCGKLPYTYPMFPNSLITYDYKPAEKQEKMEGLYDYESQVAIQYEFGRGLSYTTFEYSDLTMSSSELSPEGNIQVSVNVKNTGKRTGKEVVMLFSSDLYASISPDNQRLRGFEKINLEPGETKTVTFELTPRHLSFYNQQNQLVAEQGEFVLHVGDLEQKIMLKESVAFDEPSKLKL